MSRFHVVVLLAGLILLGGEVRAETAQDLYQEALVRYSLARFKQSQKLLHRARRLTKAPKLLGRIHLHLGLISSIRGESARAEKAFQTALTHYPDLSLDPRRFKLSIVELFHKVRSTMRGELAVSADRVGALVLVDGKPVGKVPFKVSLEIGAHRVEVRTADGHHGHVERVILSLNQRTRVDAKLQKLRAWLTVRSTPEGAEVLVDGNAVGRSPVVRTEVAAGKHAIVVRKDGFKEQTLRVVLDQDKEENLNVSLQAGAPPMLDPGADKPPETATAVEPADVAPADTGEEAPAPAKGGRLWTWIAAGGAAAALGVGIGLGAAAEADHDAYMTTDSQQQLDELKDSGQSKSLGANVMFGVGAALAVTSVVLFFVEGRTPEEDKEETDSEAEAGLHVAPFIGRTSGLWLSTRF